MRQGVRLGHGGHRASGLACGAHGTLVEASLVAGAVRRGHGALPAGRAGRLVIAEHPSVETLLHAFLPHKFVDHTHSAAVLSLTDQDADEALLREVFGDRVALVDYVKPGFDLAREATRVFEAHQEVEGLILRKHGIFSFGATAREAYEKAYATDPQSAFGGIIAFNTAVDGQTAASMINQQFIEVIIAPSFDDSAVEAFQGKPNIRVLETGKLAQTSFSGLQVQQITGGVLLQDKDIGSVNRSKLTVVSERQPTDQEVADAVLAWKVAKFVKSNAIVYCKDGATLGIGAGQTSRVTSVQVAALKATEAGLELRGAAMASDAFFPFRDGLDVGAKHGVEVVIQPGGSVRDEEVIAAANEHNIAMLFTGMRHFRH